MIRTTRGRRAILAFTLLSTALALPSSAAAGSYDVWSCRTPQGGAAAIGDANYGWRGFSSGHVGLNAFNSCSTNGYFGALFGFNQNVGARVGHVFSAPPQTTITAYELYWSGNAGGDWRGTPVVGETYAIRSDQADPNYVVRRYGGGAFGSEANPLGDVNRLAQSNLDVAWVGLGTTCSPAMSSSGTCPSDYGSYRVYRSKFTLHDSSAPELGSISGDSLQDGSFSGDETFSVNATDQGSGVYRLIFAVDGVEKIAQVINPDNGRCVDVDSSNANPYEFVLPQPCPLSNSGEVVVDTTTLPEGDHSIRLKIEDASGNKTTVWGPATRTIDNVPPPAPVDPDGTGPAVGRPAIAGVAKEGNTLVADPGSWSGEDVSFGYRWERCDAAGANCAPIDGATDKTHLLGTADVGKRLRVIVRATNAEGSADAASDVTSVVIAAGCASGCATPSTGPGGSGSGAGAGADVGVNGVGGSVLSKISAAYNGQRVIRTRYGRRVLVTGKLLNEHGSPVTGAVLDVLQRPRSGGELKIIGTVTTGSDGTFGYLLPVGASRLVRFAYRFRSGAADYTHTTDVEVIVAARVALTATRRVKGRQPLRFRGKVPAALPGSVVLLQAKVGNRWQIFEKARITGGRRFSAKYVFRRTHRPTTFRFRVLYPGRDVANLDRAKSRVVTVRYIP